MAHQSPRGQILAVKLDRTLEVNDCLVVVTSERVVVPNSAACFRPVLLILVECKC